MFSWTYLSVIAASAGVTPIAPLPSMFVNEASHAGDGDYRPVPDQRGVYARGVADEWRPDASDPPCVGTKGEQDKLLSSRPPNGPSEFWFYATKTQGMLLTRAAVIDSTKPCATALSFTYDIERAYIADGFIHSLTANESNSMEAIASSPIDHSAGAYASHFERVQSLMARQIRNIRGRKQDSTTVAGVRANCRGYSGLVWSSVCVVASGPAKGMIVRAQTGDDESTSFTMEIEELRPNVVLPGILFEVDRTWRGRE